jgi:hypothetical protein
MRLYPTSIEELWLRNPFREWDGTCAVCEEPIPTGAAIWVCEDSDINPPESVICNVIHLCATCATDEPAIRQELLAIAANYDADDPEHATALRRMAESPFVHMRD